MLCKLPHCIENTLEISRCKGRFNNNYSGTQGLVVWRLSPEVTWWSGNCFALFIVLYNCRFALCSNLAAIICKLENAEYFPFSHITFDTFHPQKVLSYECLALVYFMNLKMLLCWSIFSKRFYVSFDARHFNGAKNTIITVRWLGSLIARALPTF